MDLITRAKEGSRGVMQRVSVRAVRGLLRAGATSAWVPIVATRATSTASSPSSSASPSAPSERAEWQPGTESWRVGHPPPRLLTRWLTSAPSSRELLRECEKHGVAFNAVHCSALWVRLGKLARNDPSQLAWLRMHPAAVEVAREHTLRLLPTFAPRQLANTAYGAALCGVTADPPWSNFWYKIAFCSMPVMADFRSSELQDLVWAFASARARSPRLLDSIAAECLERIDELQPETVSVLAWSLTTLGHESSATHAILAEVGEAEMGSFGVRELSMLAWSLARAECAAPSFFDALTASLDVRIHAMVEQPAALATTAWALGKAGYASTPVLRLLADGVERLERQHGGLHVLSSRSLASLTAPFALSHEEGAAQIEIETKIEIETEIAQQSAKDAKGASVRGTTAKKALLLNRLAYEVILRTRRAEHSDMDMVSLATLAHAFADATSSGRLPRPPDELFGAIGDVAAARLDECSERELAMVAWAQARGGAATRHQSPHLFEAIAKHCVPRLHEMQLLAICTIADAYAQRFGSPRLAMAHDAGRTARSSLQARASPNPNLNAKPSRNANPKSHPHPGGLGPRQACTQDPRCCRRRSSSCGTSSFAMLGSVFSISPPPHPDARGGRAVARWPSS